VQSQENITQMQRFLQHQGYDIPVTGELDPSDEGCGRGLARPAQPEDVVRHSGGRGAHSGSLHPGTDTTGDYASPGCHSHRGHDGCDGSGSSSLIKRRRSLPPGSPGLCEPEPACPSGRSEAAGLNLPDFPNLPTLPNSQVDPHLIDPKQAAAIAQAAYKVPIQQTQRDITQQQGQGSQDITDIQNWFRARSTRTRQARPTAMRS
jgi:hypothetical protein